ncbi:MAG TPA: hypothetical protein VKC56_07365 [Gallionellaceae bacterium]|nr:hypothetical protein [Gallionellaceae bacterium]
MEKPEYVDIGEFLIDGIVGSEHQKRFLHIGDELDKVRKYASERNTDVDKFSQTIVWLAISSYYAGLVPITRIESALFLLKEFRNEYAYALIARAYIEVVARLHKGLSLWRQYRSQKKTLDEFSHGVCRLMAMFRREGDPNKGLFKECIGGDGYARGGFNVQTLIDALEKDIPGIGDAYSSLSTYAHGDLSKQMMNRKLSWLPDLALETNPVISGHEQDVLQLRAVALEDLTELMELTRPLRERYDEMHKKE